MSEPSNATETPQAHTVESYGEPWRFTVSGETVPDYYISVERTGSSIARLTLANESYAHRIVACVNACAGVPTEALEHMDFPASRYALLRAQLAEAVAERQELDAQLVRAERDCETAGMGILSCNAERDRLREALADIAKGMAPAEVMRHLELESPEQFRGRMWSWSEARAGKALAPAEEGQG